MTFEEFRSMALQLPGVEEGTSFGTPGFRVRRKFLARLSEADVLVLTRVDDLEKEMLLETQPETFFITDHHRGYPTVLIRLSRADPEQVRDLLERSWRQLAGPRLIAQLEAARG
jgi:hypothetical protein